MDSTPKLALIDLNIALLCLKLVSDIQMLAQMDMTRAIHFALKCTLPVKGGSKADMDIFWKNLANALGFLRNIIAMNEQGRVKQN
jgi:hypothetical protein